jgi:hypothetical protein
MADAERMDFVYDASDGADQVSEPPQCLTGRARAVASVRGERRGTALYANGAEHLLGVETWVSAGGALRPANNRVVARSRATKLVRDYSIAEPPTSDCSEPGSDPLREERLGS